jgi:DNA-binding MarR family transcriptional regulator
MSSENLKSRAALTETFLQEISRFSTWTVIYHQFVAVTIGLNPTDLKCGAVLSETGPLTAGELAEIVGLTTGAVTGVIDRLEQAGLVRREKDPTDRRKIIIQPISDSDELPRLNQIFNSISQTAGQLISTYRDDELAVILDFIQRGQKMLKQEIAKLRENPGTNPSSRPG